MDDYWYLLLISSIVGWVYFAAWSLSFYPQAILNYKMKSVAAFSLDFALLNTAGFFFYFMYSVGGFIYPHLGTGVIQMNDLVFAGHAFMMSSLMLAQTFIYPRGEQGGFKQWAI